jgi:hypothetical protein
VNGCSSSILQDSINKCELEQVEAAHRPAILKLNLISSPLNIPENKLLRFLSLVETAQRKTRLAYMLVDSGAFHSFVDMCFAKSLGLVPRISTTMVITTTSHQSTVLPRKQVYLSAVMRGTHGNHLSINGWYTVYDLEGIYDLIVRKNWMLANPHTVDHSTNTLLLLDGGWPANRKSLRLLVTGKSIVRLRGDRGSIRETQNYCKKVAVSAGINLISISAAYQNCEELIFLNVKLTSDPTSDIATNGSNRGPDGNTLYTNFERWTAQVPTRHADLFQ